MLCSDITTSSCCTLRRGSERRFRGWNLSWEKTLRKHYFRLCVNFAAIFLSRRCLAVFWSHFVVYILTIVRTQSRDLVPPKTIHHKHERLFSLPYFYIFPLNCFFSRENSNERRNREKSQLATNKTRVCNFSNISPSQAKKKRRPDKATLVAISGIFRHPHLSHILCVNEYNGHFLELVRNFSLQV